MRSDETKVGELYHVRPDGPFVVSDDGAKGIFHLPEPAGRRVFLPIETTLFDEVVVKREHAARLMSIGLHYRIPDGRVAFLVQADSDGVRVGISVDRGTVYRLDHMETVQELQVLNGGAPQPRPREEGARILAKDMKYGELYRLPNGRIVVCGLGQKAFTPGHPVTEPGLDLPPGEPLDRIPAGRTIPAAMTEDGCYYWRSDGRVLRRSAQGGYEDGIPFVLMDFPGGACLRPDEMVLELLVPGTPSAAVETDENKHTLAKDMIAGRLYLLFTGRIVCCEDGTTVHTPGPDRSVGRHVLGESLRVHQVTAGPATPAEFMGVRGIYELTDGRIVRLATPDLSHDGVCVEFLDFPFGSVLRRSEVVYPLELPPGAHVELPPPSGSAPWRVPKGEPTLAKRMVKGLTYRRPSGERISLLRHDEKGNAFVARQGHGEEDGSWMPNDYFVMLEKNYAVVWEDVDAKDVRRRCVRRRCDGAAFFERQEGPDAMGGDRWVKDVPPDAFLRAAAGLMDREGKGA